MKVFICQKLLISYSRTAASLREEVKVVRHRHRHRLAAFLRLRRTLAHRSLAAPLIGADAGALRAWGRWARRGRDDRSLLFIVFSLVEVPWRIRLLDAWEASGCNGGLLWP